MRVLGTFLMLLGVAALIVGLVTGYVAFDTAKQLYQQIEQGREIVTDKIDEVNTVFGDIDVIYERSQKTVADYEQGRINDLNDDRIKSLLRDVRSVSEQSMNLKESIQEDMGTLQEMRESVTTGYDTSLNLGLIGFGSLVISGWLFGFGALARGGRRDD